MLVESESPRSVPGSETITALAGLFPYPNRPDSVTVILRVADVEQKG